MNIKDIKTGMRVIFAAIGSSRTSKQDDVLEKIVAQLTAK